MRRVIALFLLTAVLAAGSAQVASACSKSRVDRRHAHQRHRIQQGFRDGNLSWRELRRLQMRQRHINGMEWRMGRDGNLSWRERAALERAQDRRSRTIHRYKNNDRDRWTM